jgi:hypothetical protein
MAELTVDGFSLVELAEMVIYPDYPDDGGLDSERTMVKQVVQKHVAVKADPLNKVFNTNKQNKDDLPPF